MNYSQTILQLYDQMTNIGYKDNELSIIYNANELSNKLCTCLYRPSGKTHTSHLIGTASILASRKIQIEIVAAGLLHSIYTHGDFGDGEYKIKEFKREYLRNKIGSEIEEYVACYANLKWGRKEHLELINNELNSYSSTKKEVVLIRLADTLDEFTDFGNLYTPNPESRMKHFEKIIPIIAEIGSKLGYSDLVEEIKTAIEQHKSAEVPKLLANHIKTRRTYLIAPMSCRKKLNIAANQKIKQVKKILKAITSKYKKLVLKTVHSKKKNFPLI